MNRSKFKTWLTNTLPVLGLLTMFVLLLFLFLKKNQPYNYLKKDQQYELVDNDKHLKSILKPITKKSLSERQKQLEQENKQYHRQVPQKYYSRKNILALITANENNLSKLAGQLKNQASKDIQKYKFGNKPFWNPYIDPQNQKEYVKLVKELEVIVLHQVESALNKNELDHVKLMAGAYWGINFLKAFHFLGYDKSGKMLLTPPELYSAYLEKQSKSKRKPANDSIYNLNSFISDSESQDYQQVNYTTHLNSRDMRKIYSSPEDLTVVRWVNILDTIVESTSSFLPTITAPDEFYEDNMQTEKELISSIRNHPEQYGYTKEEAQKINNATQIDFELFAELETRKRAAVAAIIGGGLASFSFFLENLFNKTMSWGYYLFMSVNLGIEGGMVIIQCLQGIKSLAMYKKYHGYMWQQRAQTEIAGQVFNRNVAEKKSREFEKNYLPSINWEDEFRIQQRRVWSNSLILGLTLNVLFRAHGDHPDNKAFQLIRISSRMSLWLLESFLYNFSKIIPVSSAITGPVIQGMTKIRMALRIPFTTHMERLFTFSATDKIVDYLVKALASDSLKEDPLGKVKNANAEKEDPLGKVKKADVEKVDFKNPKRQILEYFRRTSKKVLKLVGATTTNIINAGVAAIAIHSTTHLVISTASKQINMIHSTPGDDFQLALTQKHNGSTFQAASQKVLYPMCAYLAIVSDSSRGYSQEEARQNRQQACLQLIQSMEGFSSMSELEESFPQTYYLLTKEFKQSEAESFFTNKVELKKIDKLYYQASQYPFSYRNSWIAALRSIYPLAQVGHEFWKTKTILTLKAGLKSRASSSLFGYGTISSMQIKQNEVPQYTNQARMLYVLDYLGEKSLFKQHAKFEASTLNEDQKKEILQKHGLEKVNLVPEFIAYFKMHKYLLQESTNYYNHINDKEIEEAFEFSLSNIFSSFGVTLMSTWELLTNPFFPSIHNKIEREEIILREVSKFF